MPICIKSEDESFSKSSTLVGIIERLHDQRLTGCPKRCKETTYQIKTLKLPISFSSANESYLYLMSEMRSQYGEEVLMYDFNNIVSAMGGSLGLFLGISFYSVVAILAPKFNRSVGSQTQNSKEAP